MFRTLTLIKRKTTDKLGFISLMCIKDGRDRLNDI